MIIGVDEVNYSPSLAGDCVVCALAAKEQVKGVRDSKLLTHSERLELFGPLQRASWYAVVPATVQDIAQVGIYRARNLAVVNAVRALVLKLRTLGHNPSEVWVDGAWSHDWVTFFMAHTRLQVKALVNADQLIYECAAASVVAKVYMDALFMGFGRFWPGYNLECNHGSPDKVSYAKLRANGPTPYHRTEGYGPGWWEKIMGGDKC